MVMEVDRVCSRKMALQCVCARNNHRNVEGAAVITVVVVSSRWCVDVWWWINNLIVMVRGWCGWTSPGCLTLEQRHHAQREALAQSPSNALT